MIRTRAGEENRNKRSSEFKSLIIKIRDWVGFILTLAGFCLSLSGTVHINIQVQCNVTIEKYNNIPEMDVAQWNSDGHLLNIKDGAENTKKKDIGRPGYPIEWAYINLTECSYDMPNRKKRHAVKSLTK